MTEIEFDLWFIEDGYNVIGTSPWVKRFKDDPILGIIEYQNSEKELDNIGLDFLCNIATTFLHQVELVDSLLLKANINIELSNDVKQTIISNIPLWAGSEYINDDWVKYIWQLFEEWLYKTINKYEGPIEACLSNYFPNFNEADRTYFHLVETDNEEYPFGFLITYTTVVNNKVKHMPLSYALEEFKNDDKKLLKLLSKIFKASGRCDILESIIENGQIFDPNYLTIQEAYQLLKQSDYIISCGIGFRFPFWWKKKNKIHTSVTVGETIESGLTLNAILSVGLKYRFGDKELTVEELLELRKLEEGLVKLNDMWVEIDHKKLEELLELYYELIEEFGTGISFMEFIRMQQNPDSVLNSKDDLVIESGEWLSNFYNHKGNSADKFMISNNFKGKLRHYQEKGVNWLYDMLTLGFGPCLADDMGLGKTIQILAIVGTLIEEGRLNNVLLIVPSSLVGNWLSERNKFMPNLDIFVLDKTEKQLMEMDFTKKGVYISTYKMVSLRESINKRYWDLIILDEAQAIKNSNTKQTKAIKAINSKNRVIMSGTPIENSLMDLWSLFDFTNPGLLGSKNEFSKIMKKAKDNTHIYSNLRNC